MISNIYVVRDRILGGYTSGLMLCANHMHACRTIVDSMSRMKHLDDYDLYFIGTFDDDTAVLTPADPLLICSVKSIMDYYESLASAGDDENLTPPVPSVPASMQ